MKGKAKPVTGYAVGALLADEAVDSRPPLPLVGRETELAVLREALDAARLRQSRAVELVGEPGAGQVAPRSRSSSTTRVGFQLLRDALRGVLGRRPRSRRSSAAPPARRHPP